VDLSQGITTIEEMSRFHRRSALLPSSDGSGRQWLYNDKEERYEPVDRIVIRKGSVSNVESFILLVKEECRRRSNKTGDMATVVFNGAGATFNPDEKVGLDGFDFERKLSPQFDLLVKSMDKPMIHTQFIRLLQKLKPSIVGYTDLARAFRKVAFDSRTVVSSAPILEKGSAGMEISITLEAKGGGPGSQVKLPSEISMKMAFARGSDDEYEFKIDVDAALTKVGETASIAFTPIFVDVDTVTERAIDDEVKKFKAATRDLSDLLVLSDY
jgi:hypothetical protein